MIDIKPALNHLQFSTTSAMHAVQQVRIHIESDSENDRMPRAIQLVEKLFGITLVPTQFDVLPSIDPYTYCVITVQAMIEIAVNGQGLVDDVDLLLSKAMQRAQEFITKPANKWMFVKDAAEHTASGPTASVVAGIDTKVAIKADGTIKKGGKEILAVELYKKNVLEAASPMNNQQFVEVLMKQLGMTKSGSTTYAWNMKKKFGAPAGFSKVRGHAAKVVA